MYWKRVGQDYLHEDVVHTLDYAKDTNHVRKPAIIICTGRDGISKFETERWLKKYSIDYDELYIREEGDKRPDWVVKEEMWRKISEKHYIEGIYDDRLQVVRRARSLGLRVYNVLYNNF